MDTRKIEDVPFEEVHEIQRYGTYFSEKSFWRKIERVAKKVGATVLRPVFTLYYMLQDEKVPLQHKAYIVGALGYFILPFDLIPERRCGGDDFRIENGEGWHYAGDPEKSGSENIGSIS